MRTERIRFAALLVAVLTVIASAGYWGLAGFGSESSHGPTGLAAPLTGSVSAIVNPDKFVMAGLGEPDYLDPAVDYEYSGWQVIQNVYETLVWYNGSDTSELVPLLADEVPTLANGLISPDGLEYSFTIKSGIDFHDGTPLTADDVVYSIQRVLRIHDPSSMSWALEQVMSDYIQYYVGATVSEYLDSSYNATWVRAVLEPLGYDHIITEDDVQVVAEAAVEKTSQWGVLMRLTHPYAGFLQVLASPVGSIVSQDYVEAHGGIVNAEHNYWMDVHTCGTGPYQLVDWSIGYGINLTRFSGYHGSLPAVTDVQILNVGDGLQRISMLQAGDADFAYIPRNNESDFSGPNYTIHKGSPAFELGFAGFNFNINEAAAAAYGSDLPWDFFQDKKVRQAFARLYNATQFIEDAMGGNAIQPNGPIPKDMWGYNSSIPAYAYDLAQSESLFREAINPASGNSWWDDGFTIALIYNEGNGYRENFSLILESCLEGLNPNFHATVNALDWPTYLALLITYPCPFALFWLGWAPDYADPDDYVVPFLDSYSGYFPNRMSYSNATIDALIWAAAGETDPVVRYDLYSQISLLCWDDCPYIWMYQTCNFHIERSWVQGYYFNPMYGGLYYAAMWKEELNTQPTAFFTVSPLVGDVFTIYTFDASGCSDAEDVVDLLEVRWDWENDSVWDTSWSTVKVIDHQFTTAGIYTIKLEVRDTGALNDTMEMELEVVELIPEFSGLLVPVLTMAALVLLIRWRRRREPAHC